MTRPTPPLGIGIDTGGTFTDIVLFDLAARAILRKGKTPTTHGDYAICIAAAFEGLGLTPPETAALRRVVLSTTLATNAVAEERIHPCALLVEPGDIAVPPHLHPRLVLLKSQVDFNAVEVVPVSRSEVLGKVDPLAAAVEAFAVSGYGATRNPEHERQVAAILRDAYGKPVVLGSELTHQLNFLQRAQAAALNAGLLPVIVEWLEAVQGILAGLGIACPLYIVKGDGSLMDEAEARRRPVQTLFSGPAASLTGGGFLSGAGDAFIVDVGGTTTDLGRVVGGRGVLKRGGIRINGRSIAVDGLDILTFGLGGDSRFRLGGQRGYHFENRRVLPFCRAAERVPGFDLDAVERSLADQWHFGDPDLLEVAALDPLRLAQVGEAALDEPQRAIIAALAPAPQRVRSLAGQVAAPRFAEELARLERMRLVTRIALTPTDLFCAQGRLPAFSRLAAEQALALHARMLDEPPEAFAEALAEAVLRQATAVLAQFLAGAEPPPAADDPLLARVVALLLTPPAAARPALTLEPRRPVVLVGAGAPVLFGTPAPGLAGRLLAPPHGDVANAVGAITSAFLLRESVSIEPVVGGGVELFDHEGKRPFPGLAEALAHARDWLRTTLGARAAALGLRHDGVQLSEEVLEDYAPLSRRARKELVIAHVRGQVTGVPE